MLGTRSENSELHKKEILRIRFLFCSMKNVTMYEEKVKESNLSLKSEFLLINDPK